MAKFGQELPMPTFWWEGRVDRENKLYNIADPNNTLGLNYGSMTLPEKWVTNKNGILQKTRLGVPSSEFNPDGSYKGFLAESQAITIVANSAFAGTIGVGNTPTSWAYSNVGGDGTRETKRSIKIDGSNAVKLSAGTGDRRSYLQQQITTTEGANTIQVVVESYSGSGNSRFLTLIPGLGSVMLNEMDGFNPSGSFPQSISHTFTISSASAGSTALRIGFGTNANDVLATDNDEMTISGIDIKTGSVASSPIIHSGSGISTRSPDNLVITNAQNAIGQSEGVVLVEVDVRDQTFINFVGVLSLSSTNENNFVEIGRASSGALYSRVFSNGQIVGSTSLLLGEPSGINKFLIKYKSGDIKIYANGSLGQTITATFSFDSILSLIQIGLRLQQTVRATNDHIRSVKIWNTADWLTDEIAQNLTSL